MISWKYLPIVCYAFNRWYPESTCPLYVMLLIADKYLPIVCYAFNGWYPGSTCPLYVMLLIGWYPGSTCPLYVMLLIDDILEVLAHCMLCF